MLGSLRIKAFPKIMAILESIIRSTDGLIYRQSILVYLEEFLCRISAEEARNKYLISWLLYFLVSNGLYEQLENKPLLKDPITKSIATNQPKVFTDAKEFKLFQGCKTIAREVTLLKHLDVFNPPQIA